MVDGTEPTKPLELNSIGREYIFLLFAFHECRRAIEALDDVVRLAQIREIDETNTIERMEWISIFNSIRLALHFSGSVSRIFFPPREKGAAKARGKRLRQLTGIPDDHPIRERALRNHVEHMDERMDDWTSVSPRPFVGAIEMTVEHDTPKTARDALEASCPIIYYREAQHANVFGDDFHLPTLKVILENVFERIRCGLKAYREENHFNES